MKASLVPRMASFLPSFVAVLFLGTGALAAETATPSNDASKEKSLNPVELSRRAIFAQAAASADRFRACSDMRGAPATGTLPDLVVRWTVEVDGTTSGPAVDGALPADAKAAACIVAVVHSLTFDLSQPHGAPPGVLSRGPTTATFPLSSLVKKIRYEGGLSREEIKRAISNDGGTVRRCYEDRLHETPKLAGKIVVAMTIGAEGAVTEAAPQSSTITDTTFESCVLQAVRGIQFPLVKGGGVVHVSYPFVFSASQKAKAKTKATN